MFIDSFGNSYSNSKISPSVHTLGDSTADCKLNLLSIIASIAWHTDPKILRPPGVPSARNGLLSLDIIVGVIDDKLRLYGWIELAFPWWGSNSSIQLFNIIPVPSTATLLPNALFIVCVIDTMLPSLSATLKWVVLLLSLSRKLFVYLYDWALFRFISLALSKAYFLDISPFVGIFTYSGSPIYLYLSANTILKTSEIIWILSESKILYFSMLKFSKILSIWIRHIPPLLTGPTELILYPL